MADEKLETLSRRERQVLALMAEGLSNRGISERLDISRKTVESHVRNIFIKLGLLQRATHERRVLAVIAYLQGTQPDPTEVTNAAGSQIQGVH